MNDRKPYCVYFFVRGAPKPFHCLGMWDVPRRLEFISLQGENHRVENVEWVLDESVTNSEIFDLRVNVEVTP